jgi:hypothetical protein
MAALARSRQGPQVSTPGPGNTADSMNLLLQALNMMQHAALGLAAGSPVWRDVQKAITSMGRHLPQGAPTAGVQQTNVKDLLRRLVQGSFLQKIQQQQQQAPPGGQDNPAGAAPSPMEQQSPMPSTPLPGA